MTESAPAWSLLLHAAGTAVVGSLDGCNVEVHAGAAYIEPLKSPLARHAARVRAPLSGLGVGEQLGWYDRRGIVDLTPDPAVPVAASADQVAAMSKVWSRCCFARRTP